MANTRGKVRFQYRKGIGTTHPEDTNGVPRTVRGTIWLYHAEHTMELPANEKYDKEMMGVPEVLKIGAPPFLECEENHDGKDNGHDPTGDTRPGSKVGVEESDKLGTACLCTGVCEGEFGKVDHVCDNVDDGAGNDRPGGGLMESNILVKGDDLVERCATKEGDKIAADGEENEDDINV